MHVGRGRCRTNSKGKVCMEEIQGDDILPDVQNTIYGDEWPGLHYMYLKHLVVRGQIMDHDSRAGVKDRTDRDEDYKVCAVSLNCEVA